MVSIKDSVMSKSRFEKVANYELPKNVAEWNEEILDQFFEQVNYLPKELATDIVVKSVDENEGYAKGSVVVSFQERQINFPIIVKDYQLSPFDIFTYKDGEETKFSAATLNNIKKILSSKKVGTLENITGRGQYPGVKTPGGINPKTSIDVNDLMNTSDYPAFSKMSGWPLLARTEDFEKIAVQLEADTVSKDDFVDNTGDLFSNIVELNKQKRVISNDHKEGILDLKNVVKAKRAITILDSQLFDVNLLQPITAPMVCELRLYEYPSMEDFIESGSSIASRALAAMNGKPLVGVVLDVRDSCDFANNECCQEPSYTNDLEDVKRKKLRNRRNQIFISLNGRYYCNYNDYDKHGIGFYGSKILSHKDAVQKAVNLLKTNTTDNFINIDKENRGDGSDKLFEQNKEMNQGIGRYRYSYADSSYNEKLIVIYGAGNAYECVTFNNKFRRYKVNGAFVYVSDNEAIIPANVASVQKVAAVKDPVYKMVLGKATNIFLIPESSLIVNGGIMKSLNSSDIMRPSKPIQATFEEEAINKVALYVDNGRYHIIGDPFIPLQKIAGLNGDGMTTNQTVAALMTMGMANEHAKTAMKVALNKAADVEVTDKEVSIFGVRDDYINTGVVEDLEKAARVKSILHDICEDMRVNLIKEASALDDPEAVDVVLSLNFINEDSLSGYVENLREMKKISGKLAELLIASRMGLKDVDEGAVKKAMDGLNSVIESLEKVRMAIKD